MIKTAMNFLMEKAAPSIFALEGREYSDRSLTPIKEPVPVVVEIQSLQSLVSYFKNGFKAELETIKCDHVFLHVEDYRTVSLCTGLHGPFLQRSVILRAKTQENGFRFGQFLDSEKFAIDVQAEFFPSENRDLLLRVAGNVELNASVGVTDDGVSQRTMAKTGIARREEITLPNPVTLQPYRTFPEIDQPECQFVFRMKSDQDSKHPISFALFEADGNRWRVQAAKSIADYFRENLDSEVHVLL